MSIDTTKTYGPESCCSDRDGTVHRGQGPMIEEMARRRQEAIKAAGAVLAASDAAIAQMTPREQAEAAWTPTSRFSVDELEDRIRARRGLSRIHVVESLADARRPGAESDARHSLGSAS